MAGRPAATRNCSRDHGGPPTLAVLRFRLTETPRQYHRLAVGVQRAIYVPPVVPDPHPMDHRAAAEIVPILVQASQAVADTVEVCRRFATDSECSAYSDAIGQIVGAHFDVLARIVSEHPDLDPGGFVGRRG